MTRPNNDANVTDDVAATTGAHPAPDRYIAYGEYVEVDDGNGGTVPIEKTYPEPRIVDSLAPNQRGNVYSGE